MPKKDKYACFQWIRDARAQMNKDMENMTPEERVAYIHTGATEALKTMPTLTIEEARRQRQAFLHPEEETESSPKAKTVKKTSGRRKTATPLAHA